MERRKFDIDSVKDKDLDNINIKMIKLAYKIVAVLHIILAVACAGACVYLVINSLALYALLCITVGLAIIYFSWLIFTIID